MNCKLKSSVLAVLAALNAGAALAEEQALPSVTVAAQAEVAGGPVLGYRATRSSTVTKTDTALRDVPQSVQVVSEELMADQAMTSMAQVMRYVPGAGMNPGEGGRDQPVLRGISTTADFYVDGMRDDALYFRDPYNAERIEVLKGAGGMTFGRGGAGGVINRATKRPLEAAESKAEISLGSYDDKRATLDISGRISPTAGYRVNAVVEDSDGFRDGFSLQRKGINPVLEFSPAAGTSVLLGYEHFEDQRTVDRGQPSFKGAPYNAPRETFFGNAAQSPSDVKVDSFSARIEHQLAPNQLLRNSLRATHYDTLRQNVQPNGEVGTNGKVAISAYAQSNQRDNFLNQTELESRFQTGGIEHLVLTGLELGRQNSSNQRQTGMFGAATKATVNASNPLAVVTQWTHVTGVAGTSDDADNRVTANIAALYLQDQITLTPEWKAVAGVRYDRFSVSSDDFNAANNDLSHTDKKFSPRAGLIYQPNPRAAYYASYSYSFIPSGETLSLSASNADLAPEDAKNYEIGAKWDLTPRLSATAAIFRLDRANVKSVDPTDNKKLMLSGLQRTEGVEFGLQGQITPNWQVYGGYANLDAKVVKATGGSATSAAVPAGTVVPLVPRNMASLWNRVDLQGGWGLGLGLVYQSDIYASTSNKVKLPSFSRADAAVYYQISNNTKVALNVENLFDRHYYATAGGDNNIIVGTPRSGRVTLSTAF